MIIQGLVVLLVSADVLVLGAAAARTRASPAGGAAGAGRRGGGAVSAATLAAARSGVTRQAASAGRRRARACSPGSSLCRRCSCARRCPRFCSPLAAVAAARWRCGAARGGSAGARSRPGCSAASGAVVATRSGEGNLEGVFVWSALIAAMLRFATPLVFARARRDRLRAQRRHQHRPRGHDADGRLLRHLRRRPARLVAAGRACRAWRRAALLALVHAVFSIRCAPTRSSADSPSTCSRSGSPATCSSPTTATRARRTTSRACRR